MHHLEVKSYRFWYSFLLIERYRSSYTKIIDTSTTPRTLIKEQASIQSYTVLQIFFIFVMSEALRKNFVISPRTYLRNRFHSAREHKI